MDIISNSMQNVSQDDYSEAIKQQRAAQRKAQLAQMLMQGGRQNGNTVYDGLANIVRNYYGAKQFKDADNSWAEASDKLMSYEKQQSELARQQKQSNELDLYKKKKEIDAQESAKGLGMKHNQKSEHGMVFNPNAGSYSVDPVYQEQMKKIAERERENKNLQLKDSNQINRNNEIIKEYKSQKRVARQASFQVDNALTLAQMDTSQGLTGVAKMQIARVFPGIDVSNEGALDSAYTQLALTELQKFKGPTTDFEYGVAESVNGRISDPKLANIAKLKAAKRAIWFVGEQDKQLDEFRKGGGSAEDFVFNMSEEYKVSGKPISHDGSNITYADLQTTAVQNNMTIDEVLKELQRVE